MRPSSGLRETILRILGAAAVALAVAGPANATLLDNLDIFPVQFTMTIEGLAGGPLDGQTIVTNGGGDIEIGHDDPSPSPAPIDVELVSLMLVSVDPVPISITVQFPADGEIEQPSGFMTIFDVFVEIELPPLGPLENEDPFDLEGLVGFGPDGEPIFMTLTEPNVFFIPGALPIVLVNGEEEAIAEITEFTLTIVSEPGTLALFGVGAGLFGLAMRRREGGDGNRA